MIHRSSVSVVRPTAVAAALFAALATAGCGGSDEPADPPADVESESAGDDSDADAGSASDADADADAGHVPDTDVGDASDADASNADASNAGASDAGGGASSFDEVRDSLSADTRFGVVAGQLDPEPSVEINGTAIRLVFDEGSVVENGFIDCMVAEIMLTDGETLTLEYPDGDQTC